MTHHNCPRRKNLDQNSNIILTNSSSGYGCPIVQHPDREDEYYCLECKEKFFHYSGGNGFLGFVVTIILMVGLLGVATSPDEVQEPNNKNDQSGLVD